MGKYGKIIVPQTESMEQFNQRMFQAIANELEEGNRLERVKIIIMAFDSGMSKDERKTLREEIRDQA